ncbi:MAG: pentapeptide repeat-containing protein [Saprospiraceae bacterium]
MLLIVWLWDSSKLTKLLENSNRSESSLNYKGLRNKNILLSFVILSSLIFCLINYFYAKKINDRLNLANIALNDLKYNSNIEEQKIRISLLLNLISKLDSVKINQSDKTTLVEMTDRIVELSSSFKVYKKWDEGRKEFQEISSERGLLLLALIKSKMDSNSFKKVKENVSFYGADLRNADFSGLNLSGIDLANSNLQDANLQGINLNYANLSGATLIGVNLNHASLVGTNLNAAKLNWAKVNEANLQMAKLDLADLSNSTFQNSKLNNASLMQTYLYNAIFYEADLSSTKLMATYLSNANFSKTKLKYADVSRINFGSVILNDAIIQKNWIEYLIGNKNTEVDTLLKKYQIICDSITNKDSTIFRLTARK